MKKVSNKTQLLEFTKTGTGKIFIYQGTDPKFFIMRYADGSDPVLLSKKYCKKLQAEKIVYPIMAASIDKKMLIPE